MTALVDDTKVKSEEIPSGTTTSAVIEQQKPDEDNSKADNISKRDMKKDESFKKCYLKNRERIYWYIYRKISCAEDSEDIAAEVFLKLYQNWDSVCIRGTNGIMAWLYTVSRNMSIDLLRKKGRQNVRSIENEEIDEATKVYENFFENAVKEEDLSRLTDVVKTIDEDEKEILTLRFEQDLKFNEIATVIGKNEGACKMIFYRSIKKIKDKLNEQYGDQQQSTIK